MKNNKIQDILSTTPRLIPKEVEELEKATTLLDMLNAAGSSKESLFLLDHQIEEML